MPIFNDLVFRIRRPKIVIIIGALRANIQNAVLKVLSRHFNIGKEVLIYGADLKTLPRMKFLIQNSSMPIILVADLQDIPEDGAKQIAGFLKAQGKLILNYDQQELRTLKNEADVESLTFGFQQEADLNASDITTDEEVNFKMNYGGSSVPVWLEKGSDNESIYAALAAAACAVSFGLNLVEISQAFKVGAGD